MATLLRVFCKILLISPQNSYISCQMYFYFVLCLCFIKSLCKIKFMPFACLLSKLLTLWHFHFKMSNSMLYVMFGILVQHQMCFASKNPHLVWVVFLWKQCFSVLLSTMHFCMYHVFLLVFKFYANMHLNWLMSIFMAFYKIHHNVLNNVKIGQTLKSIFFYNMMSFSRTPSLPFRAYLVHFVRSFLCFATKPLCLVITGLILTRFSGSYLKCI